MAFSSIAKHINANLLIGHMQDFKATTKQELSVKTGLSFPTVSKLIDEFAENKLVTVLEEKEGKMRGRHACRYQLNQFFGKILCIYLHNHVLTAILYPMQGKELYRYEMKEKKEIILSDFVELIERIRIREKEIKAIVIGVPGAVNQGKIFIMDGYENLNGCEIEKELCQIFAVPVRLFNNMSAIALGMAQEDTIACVHFGMTSPGCGCVVNGKPLTGFYGFTGEVGFIPFDQDLTYRDVMNGKSEKFDFEIYAGKILISLIAILNPAKIYLYFEQSCDKKRIVTYCQNFLPKEIMPQWIIADSYLEDYLTGLQKGGMDLIYNYYLGKTHDL